jgi:nicotinate-nucleotide adenylyltransferase
MQKKTIIFGGSFDPPHLEHKNICISAVRELSAQKLVLVPTYAPAYKEDAVIDFELRAQMLERMFQNGGIDFEISQIERKSGKRNNYAAEVLNKLKNQYDDPCYLIGGDSLLALDTWHNYKEVLSAMPIAVAGRSGFSKLKQKAAQLEKEGGKFAFLNYTGGDISSTLIKAKLYLGLKPPLDDEVFELIKEHNLFSDYRGVVEKLRKTQSPELFYHSLAVVLRAVDINSVMHLSLDFDEVFLAALLHDNSKENLDASGYDVPKDAVGSPVMHQFLGAERAKAEFGVASEEALSAIRFHTTAKPQMTTLEKLIYCADKLSEDRDYDGMDILQKQVYCDFDKGFFYCLEHSYNLVLSKGGKVYPLTEQAYEYYKGLGTDD